MKKQRGITLIALIITIIVMLILAGVVLSLTIGERGIFKTAKGAAKNYTNASQKELADLDNFENEIKNNIALNTEIKPDDKENNDNKEDGNKENNDNKEDDGNVSQIVAGKVYVIEKLQEMIDNEQNPITVPTLESASQDGYVVTSGKTYNDSAWNWQGWRAFDGNWSNTWTFYPVTETPGWLCVEFPEPVAVYKIKCGFSNNSSDVMFKMLSSNDGENWVSRTGDDYIKLESGAETQLKTTELAKYWRFETLSLYTYYDMQFYAFHK